MVLQISIGISPLAGTIDPLLTWRYNAAIMDNPNQQEIDAFCKAHNVSFYNWGEPDDWERRDVFRVATSDFPQRGITVSLELVKKWLNPAMFAGGGI